MNEYEPTGQAFRQFQYPTLPLHVDQSELRAAVDALGPIAGVEGRSR